MILCSLVESATLHCVKYQKERDCGRLREALRFRIGRGDVEALGFGRLS